MLGIGSEILHGLRQTIALADLLDALGLFIGQPDISAPHVHAVAGRASYPVPGGKGGFDTAPTPAAFGFRSSHLGLFHFF